MRRAGGAACGVAGVRRCGVRGYGVRGVRRAGVRRAGMRGCGVRGCGVRGCGVRGDAACGGAGVRRAGVRCAARRPCPGAGARVRGSARRGGLLGHLGWPVGTSPQARPPASVGPAALEPLGASVSRRRIPGLAQGGRVFRLLARRCPRSPPRAVGEAGTRRTKSLRPLISRPPLPCSACLGRREPGRPPCHGPRQGCCAGRGRLSAVLPRLTVQVGGCVARPVNSGRRA